jgi:hypothetical protein
MRSGIGIPNGRELDSAGLDLSTMPNFVIMDSSPLFSKVRIVKPKRRTLRG